MAASRATGCERGGLAAAYHGNSGHLFAKGQRSELIIGMGRSGRRGVP
jgi:hypothetical protein